MVPDDQPGQRRRVAVRTTRDTVLDACRTVVSWLVAWVRSTPGTHVWLAVLAVNSIVLASVSSSLREFLLHHNSTNLAELRSHPVRVLIVSALWIQSPSAWAVYLVLYEIVHAPAERWLGTARWLAVAATAHIGATLISQRAVMVGIRLGQLSPSLTHTVDLGVSYGLAGVAGVLVYRLPFRWRWFAAAALLGLFADRLVTGRTFTDLGHFCSVLIGLALYRLTPAHREGRGSGPAAGTRPHGSSDGPDRQWRRWGPRR
jgi:hypothetical protein